MVHMSLEAIKFEIRGNQENDEGNPIPYVRSTQRGQFKPNVRRYSMWKQYVIKSFYDKYPNYSPTVNGAPIFSGKIFATSKSNPMRMKLFIHFASDAHADPDNIFKGIADALFSNDKYLAVQADFTESKEKIGKVIVEIERIKA
jgi:hypothetical protein